MSRRDTIIIAVLVNAGLLMVLFATANKSNREESSFLQQTATIVDESAQEDLLLDQYVTSLPTLDEEVIFSDIDTLELTSTPVETVKETPARFVNVTVKKGDYLEKIAKANKTTVAAILEVNPINPTQLKVGQILKIPINKETTASKKPSSLASEEDYYIVKDGDNPWLIASRNHIDLETLLRLNSLDEKKAKRLRPGDRLRIR